MASGKGAPSTRDEDADAARVDEIRLETEFEKKSPELSKELNALDPQLVLGLATALWPGARQALVTGVMRDKLLIGAMGKSPIREELVWRLDPPLEAVDDAKARILSLRPAAMAPGVDAQTTAGLLALMVALFGARYTSLSFFEGIRDVAKALFKEHWMAGLVFFAHFTWAVHAMEAAYAFGVARSMKMQHAQVLGWTWRTFAVGWGALGRLRRLDKAETLVSMPTCGVIFWSPEELAAQKKERERVKKRNEEAWAKEEERQRAEAAETEKAEAEAAAAPPAGDVVDDPVE